MTDQEIERWCQAKGWTEPRQLEIGIWVAFPPGGVMETPLPSQVQKSKTQPLKDIVNFLLLVITAIAMLVIATIISLLFIEPIVKRHRSH